MSTLPEQFSAARKAQVEQQLEYVRQFGTKFVESTEKVIALNLHAGRASVEHSTTALRQLFAAKDPRDLLALTSQSQVGFDSLLAYSRELLSIASGAQSALLQSATDAAATSAPLALTASPVAEVAVPAPAVPELAVPELAVPEFAASEFTPEPVTAAPALAAEPEPAAPAVESILAAAVAEPAPHEVEVELEVAADEVAVPSAPLTPLAEAIHEVSDSAAATLTAAPVPFDNQVTITGLTPVDAAPPAVGGTVSQGFEKQDQAPGKSRKKK